MRNKAALDYYFGGTGRGGRADESTDRDQPAIDKIPQDPKRDMRQDPTRRKSPAVKPGLY